MGSARYAARLRSMAFAADNNSVLAMAGAPGTHNPGNVRLASRSPGLYVVRTMKGFRTGEAEPAGRTAHYQEALAEGDVTDFYDFLDRC